jgi:xanthine dehydrogenase small subunit
MALAGSIAANGGRDDPSLKLALTGNLCRCTGYIPILDAIHSLEQTPLLDLPKQWSPDELVADLRRHVGEPMLVRSRRHTFFGPRSLDDALAYRADHPEAQIVAGGTELGVLRNKKGLDPTMLLSLEHVQGLDELAEVGNGVAFGANVTWSRVEAFAKEMLPEFYRIILRFGSPQIRHVSTLVGNVVHGSPIADSLPFLLVMDAEIELRSRTGSRRVKLNGFYKGYKIKDLAADEIVTRVLLPLPAPNDLLKLYKVSRRNDLDIATFGAAIRIQRAGDTIHRAFVAYSGVGPMVARLPQTESFLEGQPFTAETFRVAARIAQAEVKPISDVRGSEDFRLQLAGNILKKFYYECAEAALQAVHPGSNGEQRAATPLDGRRK